ncbi:hypothetical protein TEK04_06470 [Klenkia sp. LSe6-5]|uniref:Uncharacterized protein n=1 Tax=Klenkia sesuvii TaxID=3103137 RepID=A0ABU8DR86_9ACTN
MAQRLVGGDRAEQACAHLRGHGILAVESVPGDPAAVRERLRTALLARYPEATGSVVFWTADDDDAFAATGDLTRPLTLVHDGPRTGAAAQAAFTRFGFCVAPGPADRTLQVSPAH